MVGMGLRMTVVYRHSFVASFLLRYIPLHFIGIIFQLVPLIIRFGAKPNNILFAAYTLYTRTTPKNNDTKIVQLRVSDSHLANELGLYIAREESKRCVLKLVLLSFFTTPFLHYTSVSRKLLARRRSRHRTVKGLAS